MMGTGGERGSERSMLAAQHDDDDDKIVKYIYFKKVPDSVHMYMCLGLFV